MNREIKFRGKRVDNGELVYGDLYQPNTDKPLFQYYGLIFIHRHSDSSKLQVIPETVGQFTGLKDLNNKESFEDDLIKNTRDKEIYKIFWHKYRGQWMCSSKHRTRKLSEVINDAFIIGNIHDNKELINA